MTGLHADTPNTQIGDYRAALRAMHRSTNAAIRICQNANADGFVRADLVLAALRSEQ